MDELMQGAMDPVWIPCCNKVQYVIPGCLRCYSSNGWKSPLHVEFGKRCSPNQSVRMCSPPLQKQSAWKDV